MLLVVGLGNPGREYQDTRHNAGFMCVDILAGRHGLRFNRKKARSQVATGAFAGTRLVLAKPQTYMNLSGEAVRGLMRELGVPPAALLVVYDDVDLPLGTIRLRQSGSPGTHNGMRNIVDCLGNTNFPRLRIGIGQPKDMPLVDYVLQPFLKEEWEIAEASINRAADAVESLVRRGWTFTMTEFNK
jgi:PTH1 family peptidyl-tRNA hydrolase